MLGVSEGWFVNLTANLNGGCSAFPQSSVFLCVQLENYSYRERLSF